MKNHCFCVFIETCIMFAASAFCSCEKPVIPVDDDVIENGGGGSTAALGEVMIAENDTARFYLSGVEYSDITLTAYPTPQTLITDSRYRLPEKLEISGVLRNVQIPAGYWQSGQRILCYDMASGMYYTYLPGGTVTRAGYKTSYCLLPMRTERKDAAGGTSLDITVNDQWDD